MPSRIPMTDQRSRRAGITLSLVLLLPAALAAGGCGDNDTEADALGVGAECTTDEQCGAEQSCLAFKGGYCGLAGCSADLDCPENSRCVTHDDGENYCFRTCLDKTECNRNRSATQEANCSSSVVFVEADTTAKACVPPSSDTTAGTDAGSEADGDAGDKKK